MSFEELPVPFFQIDDDFTILAASREAREVFPDATQFLDLIDLASVRKAAQFIVPQPDKIRLEVHMRTRRTPLAAYELLISWNEANRANIICLEQDTRLSHVSGMLNKLSSRLAETDFQLLEQKEQLESKLDRMEQTALQNDKLAALGELAAGIAHEIRNPLTVIRGFVQLLQPHLRELGKVEYADVVLTEIDRVNHIIHEFLTTSKPGEPLKQKVSVTALLSEVILLCQSEALLKSCELDVQAHGTIAPILVDPMQIKQVLLNLIKNAMEAIEDSDQRGAGSIRLEAVSHGQHVQVHVHDNGTGMEPRTLNRLFDPFFTTKESGTGLGLAVCKRIVEQHGGTMEVSSKVGVGTTFTLIFPISHLSP